MIEAPEELPRGLARTAMAKLGSSIDPHHFAILGIASPASSHRRAGWLEREDATNCLSTRRKVRRYDERHRSRGRTK